MSDQTAVLLGMAGCFIVGLIIAIALGLSPIMVGLLPFFLCIVLLVIYLCFSFKKFMNSSKHAIYDFDKKQLTLYKRGKEAIYNINIVPIYSSMLNYNPAEITYTSYSVGAVTMGGFDYKDESYTYNKAHKTNKYRLNYNIDRTGEGKHPIETIILDSSLIPIAKKDSVVSKYLSDNKLNLCPEVEFTSLEKAQLEASIKHATTNVPINALNEAYLKRQLSKLECEKIKNWIEGRDY